MFKRLLTALLFTLTLLLPCAADNTVIIKQDEGGVVREYNQRWRSYQSSRTPVVIAGACISACARFMTLERVCATDQAYFYLHGVFREGSGVDRAAGIADSLQWESAKAVRLQQKYDSFSFGQVQSRPARVIRKEPGVAIVYLRADDGHGKPVYDQMLRVKATMLVRRCARPR